jgi:hypothetical protein
VMNSRRFMPDMGGLSPLRRQFCARLSLPRAPWRGLGADLNCSESIGVARRLPRNRLNSARNVWLTAGGEMTSHGEFRRGFADRHTQFLRQGYSCRRSIGPHGHSLYHATFPFGASEPDRPIARNP